MQLSLSTDYTDLFHTNQGQCQGKMLEGAKIMIPMHGVAGVQEAESLELLGPLPEPPLMGVKGEFSV